MNIKYSIIININVIIEVPAKGLETLHLGL